MSFIKAILRFLRFKRKKKQTKSITFGDSYAVTTGTYVGEIFIYIKTVNKAHCFLSIPKMLNREVPEDKFKYAKDNKVIEFLECVPKNERILCKLQYEYNEEQDTNN